MDPIENPYAPGAGTRPPELAGRDEILEKARILLGRIRKGSQEKSIILVGLRGVGKTALLNRISDMAEDAGYRSIMIEAPENKSLPDLLVPPLRRLLLSLDHSAKVRKGLAALVGFIRAFNVKVGDIEVSMQPGVADSGDLEADLCDLLVAAAEAAAERHQAIALIIDELQYLKEVEMSALIMALHKIAQRDLPLVLIGAGLPQIVGLAGKSKSYAERLFEYPQVGALSFNDASLAIVIPAERKGVRYELDALSMIYDHSIGYPYFLQEWGYHVWNTASTSLIGTTTVERATESVIRKLDENFFRVRFDRLTPKEKEYLFAMAALGEGPHRSGDISARLNRAVESVAPIRNSLIRKGMIFSPAHGDTAFTVPLFDQYLRRVHG